MLGERVVTGRKLDDRDKERLKNSAEQAAKVLGDLRGLALKMGQTLSYVDGILPPQATDTYQKALAKLQNAAPTVSFDEIKVELERGLGRPFEEVFVSFEQTPIAAASIGQVHRAVIAVDGVETSVAVKIQYPGISQALGSDLKNLEVMRPVLAMMAPGADTAGGMDEVVERIAEELDYRCEADNQEKFAALVAGYPDVVVPRVFRSHSGTNVLTTEFVEGRSIREIAAEGDQALRDRVGRAIFRFTLGNAFTKGVFNTDPHPGNYIVRPDGQVAFLDFGSVKWLPKELQKPWRELAEHLVRGELDLWREKGSKLLGMDHMDPRAREINQEYQLYSAAAIAKNEEVTIDRDLLRDAVQQGAATVKKVIKELGVMPTRGKTMRMPPHFVMAARMQIGLFAVLAQLRCRANWNQILREMLDATEVKSTSPAP
ncbi:MAG: AarF/ABC1/UbiB kinase family protein [Deltaproteobacteria bacterium]|nr:AarF/ABC1/UbiB kinase family protein [Deltaproteobacteria bacterium]